MGKSRNSNCKARRVVSSRSQLLLTALSSDSPSDPPPLPYPSPLFVLLQPKPDTFGHAMAEVKAQSSRVGEPVAREPPSSPSPPPHPPSSSRFNHVPPTPPPLPSSGEMPPSDDEEEEEEAPPARQQRALGTRTEGGG